MQIHRFIATSIAERAAIRSLGPALQYNRAHMRLGMLAATTAVGLILWLQVDRPAEAEPGATDPANIRLEYRPGAYMPAGFPLEGSVKLLSAPVVQAGERHRIRVEYTVGKAGVKQGEALDIWKHFTSDVEGFQVDDPAKAAYFAVETTAPGAALKARSYPNSVQRNTPNVFPYRKTAGAVLESGSLRSGDKVYFDLGGALGVRMQHYAENLFNLRIAILNEDQSVRDYGGDAFLKVVGGPASKLRVSAPAYVALGERFSVEVIPSDAWGSLARDYQGLDFDFEDPGWAGVRSSTTRRYCTISPRMSWPAKRASTASKSAAGTGDCEGQASDPSGIASQAPRLLRRPASAHLLA